MRSETIYFSVMFSNSHIFEHRFCKSYLEARAVRIPCLFSRLSRHGFDNELFSNASEMVHNAGVSG